MREHEGQPVLEAGASVYRLGPRCRTQAQMHDLLDIRLQKSHAQLLFIYHLALAKPIMLQCLCNGKG
jgi:hypothetical protein